MERNNDVMGCLLHGCSLARTLESNLQNLASDNPRIVSQQCDEIVRIFATARHHLSALHNLPLDHGLYGPNMGALGFTQQEGEGNGKGKEVAQGSFKSSLSGEGHELYRGSMEAGGSSSSVQLRNPGRSSRKDDVDGNKKRVRVWMPVPQMGNVDVPPEDGYTWRKYGQKEILRAKFPRSYYRCTHQKLYNCPAKKQVQRLDDDPSLFEILYRGEHICHNSSTAPSVPPPPSQPLQDIVSPHKPTATVHSLLNHWLSVDFPRPICGGANTVVEPNEEAQVFRLSRSISNPGNYSAPEGLSTVGSHHHEMDFADFLDHTVEDLVADVNVILNSGSCGRSSMEVFFPTSDDKWEPKDKKN